jgi:Ribbon-helix-helix protein, copG family
VVRTQIQLLPEQVSALKRVAGERGISMAEVIREAVDRYVVPGPNTSRRQRAIAAIGGFRSGHHDVGTNHDRHLADAFAE